MAKIIQNEIEYFSSKQINIDKQTESASVITYDNANSGLEAGNVQDAVDEVAEVTNFLAQRAVVIIKDEEYASLEEFVEATNTESEEANSNGKFVIFDDTTGWGPTETANVNYRGYVIYQNYYGDDITDSVNGNVTLYIDNNSYTGIISGNKTNGVSVTWEKIINSTDLDELKKSVSDGKTLVADAITAKGVETATDATFATMAANIGNINSNLSKQKTGIIDVSGGKIATGFKPKTILICRSGCTGITPISIYYNADESENTYKYTANGSSWVEYEVGKSTLVSIDDDGFTVGTFHANTVTYLSLIHISEPTRP